MKFTAILSLLSLVATNPVGYGPGSTGTITTAPSTEDCNDFPRKPNMADYRILYDVLLEESEKSSDNIPHWARSSFHDLANFDPATGQGGPHGCMRDDPVRSMAQNEQLDGTIRKLNRLVNEKLPGIAFPFGDVISMAGKVAIEKAFPDIRRDYPIKWRPGRPPCGKEIESGPGGGIQTYREFAPFFKRYSFTPREMAILLAGTHGLKDGVVHIGKSERPWTTRNSGREFVLDSLNKFWWYDNKLELETAGIPHVFTSGSLIRLPVDMVFFPTSVSKTIGKPSNLVSDKAFLPVENDLRNLVRQNESVFNREFSKIFSKMLESGVNGKEMGDWYVDSPKPHDNK
jgi:hypothetical protein